MARRAVRFLLGCALLGASFLSCARLFSTMTGPAMPNCRSGRCRAGSRVALQAEVPEISLTYFNIEGAAEKVRLALVVGEIDFQDVRVQFPEWQTMKPTTKFGQLPLMKIDGGSEIAQSGAMLRYVGSLSATPLYPADPWLRLKVDEVIGLVDDMATTLAPSLYVGMRPDVYGYPADMPQDEKKSIQQALRAKITAVDGQLTRQLGYLDAMLAENGSGFFVGTTASIADCAALAQLRALKSGRLDGISADLVDGMPNLKLFYEKMHAIPAVKEWYASH